MNVSRIKPAGRLRRFMSNLGNKTLYAFGYGLVIIAAALVTVIVLAWLLRFAAYSIGAVLGALGVTP